MWLLSQAPTVFTERTSISCPTAPCRPRTPSWDFKPHDQQQQFGFTLGGPVPAQPRLSLGARYDLQTLTTKGLQSNPLWPDAGRVPYNSANVGPRVLLACSVGKERPLVIRAGFGLFYNRIPQIYTSAIQSESGLVGNFLFLK
jgi:hypothetical protein